MNTWQFWAGMSALFAALTAILAKIGVDKLSVVLVAVIGALFLGEKLTGTNWTGVAMIGIGEVLVALK